MRRLAAAIGVVCALLIASPAHAGRAGAVRLRVATYNIQAGMGADGVFDVDRTAAAIAAMHVDLVGLQEVDVHWSARSGFSDVAGDLARRLHMRAYFAPIYSLDPVTPGAVASCPACATAPRREFGVAILTRLPVLSAENHEITRLSTQEPDPVPRPAPGFPEVVVAVHGVRLHVYTTHLDYRPDPAVRAAQVSDMLAVLDADRGPKLLIGDFNATADAPELAPLWTRLDDAWGDRPGGETYPATAPVKRIDHIAVPAHTGVCAIEVVDTLASDHRPLVADLTIRPW
jgi:endonuclease/exonuclease/phosphatase family metal-dependent hydrolase